MFKTKLKAITLIGDDTLFWIIAGPSDGDYEVVPLPLEMALTGEGLVERLPRSLKGNHRSLMIVPDHWMAMERYPFQSRKPALIESFLERKLCAAFPDHTAVRHFFNYKSVADAAAPAGLAAYFLTEEKGFRLYATLEKLGFCPRHIATPGLLWADRLAGIFPSFKQEGSLLVHMTGHECFLYFYRKADFLFSRTVALADAPDHLEALVYEINQSLYMFSQKTKSELNGVYLLARATEEHEQLHRLLGRSVTDITPHVDQRVPFDMPDAPWINGLFQSREMFSRPPHFSIMHRQARRTLEWAPVQHAGLVIGMAMMALLIAENWVLRQYFNDESELHQKLQRQTAHMTGTSLDEVEQRLDLVLAADERPDCAVIVKKVLASLPEGMRIEELAFLLDGPPALSLKARLAACDTDRLKSTLARLTQQLKNHFRLANDISIDAFQVQLNPHSETSAAPDYMVALRVELI